MINGMSRQELLELPAVVDLPTAARVLRIGRTAAYRQAATGAFPVRVFRVGGGAYRVSTADLLALIDGPPTPPTTVAARETGHGESQDRNQ